jgi:leucine dehydrogenase
MHDLFDLTEALECARVILWSDRPSGLRAVLAIDDVTLGPAAGGIRTRAYATLADAIEDAARLARAMTIKNALANLDAGGGKVVVIDHPGLNRPAAFARLGQFIAELNGLLRTAGDLGTTSADLEAAARYSNNVNTTHGDLSGATARTLLGSIRACAEVSGRPGLAGLRVAIQGCGAIGDAAARALAAAGVELVVADVDPARAEHTAAATGARVAPPDRVLLEAVDVVSPCAVGGVVTAELAGQVAAWAVCGAANNVLADADAERRLHERGILFVPDAIASSGAVIHGVSRSIMGLPDSAPLIDAVEGTAREVLLASRSSGRLATEIAVERARQRIRAAAEARGITPR